MKLLTEKYLSLERLTGDIKGLRVIYPYNYNFDLALVG